MRNYILKPSGLALILLLAIAAISCSKQETPQTPSVTIASQTLSASKDGGNVVLAITANTDWTVVMPTEATWVAAAPLKGTGSASVTFTLLPNTGAPREANVSLMFGTNAVYLKVQQDGVGGKPTLPLQN